MKSRHDVRCSPAVIANASTVSTNVVQSSCSRLTVSRSGEPSSVWGAYGVPINCRAIKPTCSWGVETACFSAFIKMSVIFVVSCVSLLHLTSLGRMADALSDVAAIISDVIILLMAICNSRKYN